MVGSKWSVINLKQTGKMKNIIKYIGIVILAAGGFCRVQKRQLHSGRETGR